MTVQVNVRVGVVRRLVESVAVVIAEAGKLAAFVLPLGVDTFAVAAAVGAASVKPQARRRITALFVALEAGMPLIGLLLGAPLARAIGDIADYAAGALLIAVGAWMLFVEDEERRLSGSGAASPKPTGETPRESVDVIDAFRQNP